MCSTLLEDVCFPGMGKPTRFVHCPSPRPWSCPATQKAHGNASVSEREMTPSRGAQQKVAVGVASEHGPQTGSLPEHSARPPSHRGPLAALPRLLRPHPEHKHTQTALATGPLHRRPQAAGLPWMSASVSLPLRTSWPRSRTVARKSWSGLGPVGIWCFFCCCFYEIKQKRNYQNASPRWSRCLPTKLLDFVPVGAWVSWVTWKACPVPRLQAKSLTPHPAHHSPARAHLHCPLSYRLALSPKKHEARPCTWPRPPDPRGRARAVCLDRGKAGTQIEVSVANAARHHVPLACDHAPQRGPGEDTGRNGRVLRDHVCNPGTVSD